MLRANEWMASTFAAMKQDVSQLFRLHYLPVSLSSPILTTHDNRLTNKDAMGCSVVGTHDILKNERTCRKVKEFANILSIGHQKLACLDAGFSEERCMNDFSCCLTYEKRHEVN